MSEGEAAAAAAPAPAGLAPGDAGPTILPNPPSIQEALAVNEPALAEPAEHAKQAKDKPEGDEKAKADGEEKPEVKDDPEDGDEPKKKLPGSQRLKRAVAKLEAEYEALARENRELKANAAPKDNPQGKPGVDRAPTEADFPNDYAAFDRALHRWTVKEAVREVNAAERAATLESRAAKAQQEFNEQRVDAYNEYADVVRDRIPDFDKVVRAAKDVVVKDPVVEELLASDKSALLQYHLAKNPDLVRELNAMTPRELAKEIGRLEARVHLPKPKTATEAPAPLSNPTGGAAPAFNPTTASMDEYVKARNSGWTGR